MNRRGMGLEGVEGHPSLTGSETFLLSFLLLSFKEDRKQQKLQCGRNCGVPMPVFYVLRVQDRHLPASTKPLSTGAPSRGLWAGKALSLLCAHHRQLRRATASPGAAAAPHQLLPQVRQGVLVPRDLPPTVELLNCDTPTLELTSMPTAQGEVQPAMCACELSADLGVGDSCSLGGHVPDLDSPGALWF